MNNKIILAALAMDLKRVALGNHRNSLSMAERFYLEAMKRRHELNEKDLSPYIKKILEHLDQLPRRDRERRGEDALMYSTLIQNYVLYK